jgi:hypothetical protein
VESCLAGEAPGPECRVYLASSSLENPTTISKSDLNPNFRKPLAYQAPRSVRFGVKLSF